jgi:hypothetical protein
MGPESATKNLSWLKSSNLLCQQEILLKEKILNFNIDIKNLIVH